MSRLTKMPDDLCPIWGLEAVTWERALPWLMGAAAVIAIIAALSAVLVCIWLMPREATK